MLQHIIPGLAFGFTVVAPEPPPEEGDFVVDGSGDFVVNANGDFVTPD